LQGASAVTSKVPCPSFALSRTPSAFSQLLEITLRAQNQYSNFTTFMNLTHFVSLYAWE
jgi:hypothetical protein